MKRKFVLSEVESMGKYVRMILRDITRAYAEVSTVNADSNKPSVRSSADYAVRRQHLDAIRQVDDAQYKLRRQPRIDRPRRRVARSTARRCRLSLSLVARRSRRVRKALFLLKLHDDPERGVNSWRFTGETEERRIPAHWLGQVSSPILSEVGLARER